MLLKPAAIIYIVLQCIPSALLALLLCAQTWPERFLIKLAIRPYKTDVMNWQEPVASYVCFTLYKVKIDSNFIAI